MGRISERWTYVVEKPLFIPLKGEYFDAFRDGEKDTEFRVYGARWNERTCTIGRSVVLSRGYGKSSRLTGVVAQFERLQARSLNGLQRIAWIKCYGSLELDVAAIKIALAAK
jgi:hypothetical protein